MAVNWSGGGQGALAGATAGSAFGPWGTGIGGTIGGTIGLLSGDGSSPDKLKKISTGTQEQEALHNNILAQLMNMSQKGGGYNNAQNYYNQYLGDNQQQAFDQFSQPYLQQFQEQMLPQIAERFAGAGALSSSGFGQALGGAAAGLQSQLAQLFSSLQGQAAQQQYGQYNQLSQQGLNHQPFGYNQQEGSMGFLGPLLAEIVKNNPGGISSLFKKTGGGDNGGGGNSGGIGMSPETNVSGKYGLPSFLGM